MDYKYTRVFVWFVARMCSAVLNQGLQARVCSTLWEAVFACAQAAILEMKNVLIITTYNFLINPYHIFG